MAIWAHILGGTVQNIIVADTWDIANAVAPDGIQAVDVTGQSVGIGYTYDGTQFHAPPQPEPELEPDPAP